MSEQQQINLEQLEKMELQEGFKIHIKGHHMFYIYKFKQDEKPIFVMQDHEQQLFQITSEIYYELLQMANFDEIEKKERIDEE